MGTRGPTAPAMRASPARTRTGAQALLDEKARRPDPTGYLTGRPYVRRRAALKAPFPDRHPGTPPVPRPSVRLRARPPHVSVRRPLTVRIPAARTPGLVEQVAIEQPGPAPDSAGDGPPPSTGRRRRGGDQPDAGRQTTERQGPPQDAQGRQVSPLSVMRFDRLEAVAEGSCDVADGQQAALPASRSRLWREAGRPGRRCREGRVRRWFRHRHRRPAVFSLPGSAQPGRALAVCPLPLSRVGDTTVHQYSDELVALARSGQQPTTEVLLPHHVTDTTGVLQLPSRSSVHECAQPLCERRRLRRR